MANNRALFPNIFYHIYNRGFNKQTLFFSDYDFQRLGKIIDRYRNHERYDSLKILSYCFLPNHFHLLIINNNEEEKDKTGLDIDVKLPEFMHKVQVSYAMYFNRVYGDKVKKGLKMPVFEGRFQAKEVTDDDYLNHLKNYIEFNAFKHGIVKKPSDWPYSSYDEIKSDKYFLSADDFDPYFE